MGVYALLLPLPSILPCILEHQNMHYSEGRLGCVRLPGTRRVGSCAEQLSSSEPRELADSFLLIRGESDLGVGMSRRYRG
jgi:hypothetical protein